MTTEELPKGLGNGTGTARCYKVQARMVKGCGPKTITGARVGFDNILTDSKWEMLSFAEASIGVPNGSRFDEYARHGYLSYASAQALRWWFIAEQKGFSAIETRLLECEFKYSFSAEAVAVQCMIDPEQREDIMPDWGKEKPTVNKELV